MQICRAAAFRRQGSELCLALDATNCDNFCGLGNAAVQCSSACMGSPGRYLHALEALRDSPFLARCKRTTRLRLQMELHSLTQVRVPGVTHGTTPLLRCAVTPSLQEQLRSTAPGPLSETSAPGCPFNLAPHPLESCKLIQEMHCHWSLRSCC